MAKVSFRLVMPEREVLATEADMVVVPGSEGDFGVLPGHAPLISTVRPGVLEVYQGSKVDKRFVVVGGFAEVTPERCTVLADEAIPFEQVTADLLVERERAAQRDLTDAATAAERAKAEKDLAVAQDLQRARAYYATR
ncbi:MAG: ATP synthase F1 subunit epsilon [Pseudomonadota bacterium]